MKAGQRWRRMSQLVDIDLEKSAAQLKAYEDELHTAQTQWSSLAQFRTESEQKACTPCDYRSVQQLQRQVLFIESLQLAMNQQQSVIANQQQRLELTRQQVQELYQKKESYLLLAKQAQRQEQEKNEIIEDNFLDELAQNRCRSNDEPNSNDEAG